MKETHRVFRRSQVVAEYEVKLILAVPHPRNRRDRVVRLAVRLREDHCVGVRVLAPLRQNLSCQLAELRFVPGVQTQHRHRILHNAAVHILEAGNLEREFRLCLLHRERVVAALEVLMRQNAAAHDGQIGVTAEEVVRELLDERKQLVKSRPVNNHRRMLRVHDDRVFIVIDVGRVLESPRLIVHGHRHDAQILPRWVRDCARIANILDAEQALRVSRRLFQLRRRDIARVFFGLGEVDGDFQLTVLRLRRPVLVLRDTVTANIIAVLTQLVEIVRRSLGRFCVKRPELPHDLRRARGDAAHEPRVKQVALRNRVVDLSVLDCIVAQDIQTFRKLIAFFLLFVAFQLQLCQQAVPRERLVQRMQQLTALCVIEQRVERRVNLFRFHIVSSFVFQPHHFL